MANETFGSINIISDVGADANSYASVAFTKSQWAIDPNKTDVISDEDIARLLIYSTMIFDAELGQDYDGSLYNNSYALYFPRTGCYDGRGIAITDYTVFPLDLQKAITEQAYYLNGTDVYADLNINGVKSQSLSGVGSRTFYDLGELRSALQKDSIFELAKKIVSPLVVGGYTSNYSSRIVRG